MQRCTVLRPYTVAFKLTRPRRTLNTSTIKQNGTRHVESNMQSNEQLVNELRTAPVPWMDAAIVVAFENRFEFVGEDHPDPMSRLNSLQQQGGLAIGLAGMEQGRDSQHTVFSAQLFQEFNGQSWAHRYMDILRGIVRSQSSSK